MSLPRSALLSLWVRATSLGLVGPDDFAAAVLQDDPVHLVVGWPGTAEPLALIALPGAVQRLGTDDIRVALPAPGHPIGLGGPPDFNAAALEAGEAVILRSAAGTTYGLVPGLDARTVLWDVQRAAPAPTLDRTECGAMLRRSLVDATAELVRLDVASWQPEIPDLLLNLRHRPGLPFPPGTDPRTVENVERAVLCLDIVELALRDDGGAVTAHEMTTRRRCLTDLDAAARRTLVAYCSDSLRAP